MDKNIASLFVMDVAENERNDTVYIDQDDPSRSYIFDEEGNLVAQKSECNVKMEQPIDSEQSQENDMLQHSMPAELNDQCLVMLNDLDEVSTFEECLMPELDSNLVNMDMGEENLVMQHMDIREPLTKLRKLLENRLDRDLSDYMFTLQETQVLEAHKNLVDQCVQGEGVVQVNAQIQPHLKQINIVDVLKPAEDYMDMETTDTKPGGDEEEESNESANKTPKEPKVIHQWQVDNSFMSALTRLKIPSDPEKWNVMQVRHWIQWAVRQFNLAKIKLSDWSMSGAQLFAMDIHHFQKIVPSDPGDVFWTHFELLRKMRVVAIIKKEKPKTPKLAKQQFKDVKLSKDFRNFATVFCDDAASLARTSYSSGQVQLWQFLLELLTSKKYKTVISWIGDSGEFMLIQPEIVAQLWGERKNKPTMNYEKLSRALRYYYDGDMICKVPRKRFVYKFVCDLKQLIGYSAIQLSNLINFSNPNVYYLK